MVKTIIAWLQEARRISIAVMQHITLNEFLPILLGKKYTKNLNLLPLTKGFSNEYRDNFNPSVTNAFAAAAFRFGHNLVNSIIK